MIYSYYNRINFIGKFNIPVFKVLNPCIQYRLKILIYIYYSNIIVSYNNTNNMTNDCSASNIITFLYFGHFRT